MTDFDPQLLKQLYVPAADSHKGQNGKLLLIGGSQLFHAASLWPLTVASRMLDMVFYSSVPENNELVANAKAEFRNGIVVPRSDLDHYITEADVVLIGPGLMRTNNQYPITNDQTNFKSINLNEINDLPDEGEQTYCLTRYLIQHYPEKRIVFDGGSLQMMDPEWLLGLKTMPILTPHAGEYQTLISNIQYPISNIQEFAKKYNSVVLLKGPVDTVASLTDMVSISGGNAGMTKGGTGDVLAGLVASLFCKNDAYLSACAGSYINKKAGESLEKKVGLNFNASDLAAEIPSVLSNLL